MAKKILLVEDESLLSNLLKQRLEKEGMEVIQARDGEEALGFLRTTKPDLIILDIILPKVSGFEVLQFLQSDPQLEKAPVIIASNLGQEADVNKGKNLGATQYFVKAKMSIEDLVGEVKKAVNGPSVLQ
jgi:DNA-binding response OmpR family regulator